MEERKSSRFGKSWGWVNEDKFFKSGWTLAKGDKYTSLVYPPLKGWSIVYSMGPPTWHNYRFPILLPFSEAYKTASIGSLWPLDWTVCLSCSSVAASVMAHGWDTLSERATDKTPEKRHVWIHPENPSASRPLGHTGRHGTDLGAVCGTPWRAFYLSMNTLRPHQPTLAFISHVLKLPRALQRGNMKLQCRAVKFRWRHWNVRYRDHHRDFSFYCNIYTYSYCQYSWWLVWVK